MKGGGYLYSNYWNNLKLTTKVYISYLLTFVVLIVVLLFYASFLKTYQEKTETMYHEGLEKTEFLTTLSSSFDDLNAEILTMFAISNDEDARKEKEKIEAQSDRVSENIDILKNNLNDQTTEKDIQLFQTFWISYTNEIDHFVTEDFYTKYGNDMNYLVFKYKGELKPKIDAMNNILTKWVNENDDQINDNLNNLKSSEQQMFIIQLGLLIGSLICSILIFSYMAKTIAKPILFASETAKKASLGNIGLRIQSARKDEIGQMSNTLDQVLEETHQIVHRNQKLANDIARSTQILSEEIENTFNHTKTVTQLSVQISDKTNDQWIRTKESFEVLQKMDTSAESASMNAHLNADHLQTSLEVIQNVRTSFDMMERKFDLTHRKMEAMNKIIFDMVGKVQEINQIIELIKDVSKKTYLLAINAAIKSSKEKDTRNGFSVVSDHVLVISKNIEHLTLAIIESNQKIEIQSKQLQFEYAHISEKNKQAANTFNWIKSEFENLFSGIDVVTGKTFQMNEETTNIKKIISGISEATEEILHLNTQTNTSSADVATLMNEQTHMFQEVLELSEHLKHITEELEQSINYFKL